MAMSMTSSCDYGLIIYGAAICAIPICFCLPAFRATCDILTAILAASCFGFRLLWMVMLCDTFEVWEPVPATIFHSMSVLTCELAFARATSAVLVNLYDAGCSKKRGLLTVIRVVVFLAPLLLVALTVGTGICAVLAGGTVTPLTRGSDACTLRVLDFGAFAVLLIALTMTVPLVMMVLRIKWLQKKLGTRWSRKTQLLVVCVVIGGLVPHTLRIIYFMYILVQAARALQAARTATPPRRDSCRAP